jgi:hypothetical protein
MAAVTSQAFSTKLCSIFSRRVVWWLMQACCLGGLGSVPGQSMWDFQWAEYDWAGFFLSTGNFIFHCQYHTCSYPWNWCYIAWTVDSNVWWHTLTLITKMVLFIAISGKLNSDIKERMKMDSVGSGWPPCTLFCQQLWRPEMQRDNWCVWGKPLGWEVTVKQMVGGQHWRTQRGGFGGFLQIWRNPWLGGYRPPIPVLFALCPLNLLNPPRQKILGTPLGDSICILSLTWLKLFEVLL